MSDLDAIREDVAMAARSAEMARHVALDHAPELLAEIANLREQLEMREDLLLRAGQDNLRLHGIVEKVRSLGTKWAAAKPGDDDATDACLPADVEQINGALATEAFIDLTGLPMMSPNGRPNHFARARDDNDRLHRELEQSKAAIDRAETRAGEWKAKHDKRGEVIDSLKLELAEVRAQFTKAREAGEYDEATSQGERP